jgi:Zn-dependent protease
MFGRSFRIATIGGIPVNVDSSWIWIAVVAVYSLWTRFERGFPGLGDGQAIAYAVVAAALFFGSVFLHEVAHAVTARLAGGSPPRVRRSAAPARRSPSRF